MREDRGDGQRATSVRARESITSLAIPGGWTEREVTVGPHVFRLLTPADPDEFLNHLVEPLDTTQPHLADPYWAKVWPAAGYLAEAVVRARSPVSQGPEPEAKVQKSRPESKIRTSKIMPGARLRQRAGRFGGAGGWL